MTRTNRKPKTGSKAIDPTCRNHGTCPECGRARKVKTRKREPVQEIDQ